MIVGLRARIGDIRAVRVCAAYLETPFASLQLLLFSAGGLILFGLMMSASTTISASEHTAGTAMWSQLIRELGYLVLSIPVLWLTARLSPKWYRRLAYPALGIALIVLLGVLVPGVGVQINGARRWIQVGPLTVQPSEFAKLAVLLWGADLLARKDELGSLKTARHIMVPLVPVFAAVMTLVMTEPDLGTTLCFILVLLGLLWMVGLPLRYFVLMLVAVSGAVTLLAVTEPYRLARLTTFLHPSVDPSGSGYHTLQGLYALASGGVFGVGLGQGTSKYGWVPNANTDYVFAVVGEELGLLGCLFVLLLFGLFTYSAIRIAHRSSNCFVRLVASGTAIWIAGQALINIGYVTALLPVTGIPLPFISNGGTSLVLTCGVLGMLIAFARHEPAAVAAAAKAAADGRTPRWARLLRLGTPRPIPAAKRRPSRQPAVRQPAVRQPAAQRSTARQPVREPAVARVANPVRPTRPGRVAAQPVARTARPVVSDLSRRRA